MKIFLALLLSIEIGCCQLNISSPFFVGGVLKPSAAASSYLINQNFEGTGYDNSETWNEQAGTPDEDYTTTVLEGSQSLHMNGSAATQSSDSPNFGDQATLYGFFRLHVIAFAGADREICRMMLNAAQSGSLEIRCDADGDLTIQHGRRPNPHHVTVQHERRGLDL